MSALRTVIAMNSKQTPDTLFQRWECPTEDDPPIIGDIVRFRISNASITAITGKVELSGCRILSVRVNESDHWAYDVGQIVDVVVSGAFRNKSLEVYR